MDSNSELLDALIAAAKALLVYLDNENSDMARTTSYTERDRLADGLRKALRSIQQPGGEDSPMDDTSTPEAQVTPASLNAAAMELSGYSDHAATDHRLDTAVFPLFQAADLIGRLAADIAERDQRIKALEVLCQRAADAWRQIDDNADSPPRADANGNLLPDGDYALNEVMGEMCGLFLSPAPEAKGDGWQPIEDAISASPPPPASLAHRVDVGDARDAARYRWLRERDLDTIERGGVFAGMTPENYVLNGEDLDAAIDAAMEADHAQG
jgi:hypothetical protein